MKKNQQSIFSYKKKKTHYMYAKWTRKTFNNKFKYSKRMSKVLSNSIHKTYTYEKTQSFFLKDIISKITDIQNYSLIKKNTNQ